MLGILHSKGRHAQGENMEEEVDHYDTHITTVLSSIIKERKVTSVPTFPGLVHVANPQATRRTNKKGFDKTLSKSIFAQQFEKEEKLGTREKCTYPDQHQSNMSPCKPAPTFTYPRLVSGAGLVAAGGKDTLKAIHDENVERLSRMSVEEIRNEQEKLKASLDLKTIAFIKRRKDKTLSEDEPASKVQNTRSPDSDLPVNIDGKWMNMNNVEEEKMEWTKRIPETTKDKEVDLPNRFGFEGELLSWEDSSVIPSHVGLHHHGDEPDLAGYTLQELVSLSRSGFLQQRVFAIRLLARIITKDKSGDYRDALQGPVLPLLVDAGVAFIFRWALDEHSESGIQAAVEAIFSLLVPLETQTTFLDEIMLSHRGYEFPSLQPESSLVAKETKDESDFELTSRDLVLGYVRMDTLLRIRYILEVCLPEASVVHKCLEILTRISQHSAAVALRLLDCPRLIKCIVTQYLTLGAPSQNTAPTDDRHRAGALRMLRVICMSGRHAASRLVSGYQEIKIFTFSMLTRVAQCSDQDPPVIASELECWRLWTVCVSYGIGVDWFRDATPALLEHFQVCIRLVTRSRGTDSLRWVEHVTKFLASALTNLASGGAPPNTLHWGETRGFYPVVATLLKQAVRALTHAQSGVSQGWLLGVVACTLDVVATFHGKSACSSSNLPSEVEDVVATLRTLHPLVLKLQDAMSSPSRSPSSLPSLPQPLTGEKSPRHQRFVSSFLRYSVAMARADRGSCACHASLLSGWRVNDVDGRMVALDLSPPSMRLVRHSIYWLVKLYVISSLEHSSLLPLAPYFHSLSLSCLSSFVPGEECWGHDLLSHVTFHPTMVRDAVDDMEPPSLRTTYLSSMSPASQHLSKSISWSEQNPQEIASFFLPPYNGPILPRDWPFLPIISLYDATIHRGEAANQASSSFMLQQSKSSLGFLLFLERGRSDFWMRVSCTSKITRLMCLYMAGSDIFLDGEVRRLLECLFRMYCATGCDVDFKQAAEGIVSFYDFYSALLDQFDAVSYGDHLFSSVLLLPLTQGGDKQCKLALWAEHADAIRSVKIGEGQLLLPARLYLSPIETDYDVIRAYLRALVTGKCVSDHSPFLHKMALHHIAEYYKLCTDEKRRMEISSAIGLCGGVALSDPS